ncbi:hypothetical protein Daura_20720 [Dactylosporangium aurantiacum]|uniref:Uncharacterized protein n=1 Tax=Dactylosporangium aurantiacum TaxID=35754 RepID=A0A9Q9MIX5_9ACTN|nr:hypothetical protein [Dactylosporangium aurantiacum]MDG6109988.1 hypothetical protein [Dactylosporangium aurantiacum]UWZ58389.1 hypothetical protein Daura_20720 [Dactylosporangium aurantiacum]
MRGGRVAGHPPQPVRASAQTASGSIDDYLDEVELARRHAAELTDAAVAAGRPAPALHDEIWFGLVGAGLRGRRDNISADLLELAVTEGSWTSRRALAQLHRDGRLVPGHGRSVRQLLPHVPEDDRRRLIALASASTATAEHDYARVFEWVDLLPHLTPEERAATTARIMDELLAMDKVTFQNMLPVADALALALGPAGNPRPQTLVALGPVLSEAQLDRAMAAAVAFDDGNPRRRAVHGLASHLPPPLVIRYAGVAARDTFTMTAMARRASAIVAAEPGQAHVALTVLRTGLAAPERRIAYAALAELTGVVAAVTGGDLGPTLDAVLRTAASWR